MMAYPPPATALLSSTDAPLRVGRYRHSRWRLYLGRIELFDDTITLQSWAGAEKRRIALAEIEKLRIRTRTGVPGKLAIHLNNSEVIVLAVRGAMRWKYVLEDQCAYIGNNAPKRLSWSTPGIPTSMSKEQGLRLSQASMHVRSIPNPPSTVRPLFEPAI